MRTWVGSIYIELLRVRDSGSDTIWEEVVRTALRRALADHHDTSAGVVAIWYDALVRDKIFTQLATISGAGVVAVDWGRLEVAVVQHALIAQDDDE